MPIDTNYITTNTLEPVFLDKNTGLPLANGTVEFWQDDNRVVPKNVFELTGAPPNYAFTELPNPITLSSIGTIEDGADNNVAAYYYPLDANGNQQLYYVVVRDQFGNLNFTREAWPNTGILTSGSPTSSTVGTIENMISNPQFVAVNFGSPSNLPLTVSIPYTAGTNIFQFAPDWEMQVTSSGTGSITLTQTAVAGSPGLATNPPFILTVTPGANITALLFRQILHNDPAIWASTNTVPTFVNGGMLMSAGTFSMNYVPNSAAPSPTLIFLTNSVASQYFNATVQIPISTNANDGNTGSVAIEISTPITGTFSISSVQVVGLYSNTANIPFQQLTAARQIDHLFNYYNPLLQYKPISSYLVGWDFPLNPAQFLGSSGGPFATGNNTSNYVWDQTIVFQDTDNGFTFDRGAFTSGSTGLQISMAPNSSMALIQYLPMPEVRKLFIGGDGRISVNVCATSSISLLSTISLWVCTDSTLPAMSTNTSLVATLDANGKPIAPLNGTWIEVPRSNLGNAFFNLASTINEIPSFGFSGWQFPTTAIPLIANFFAIVVGVVNPSGIAQGVVFDSISLVPGDIPTIPAPQSSDAVYKDCCRYYEKSFLQNIVPASAVGFNTGEFHFAQTKGASVPNNLIGSVPFTSQKVRTPTMTFYNPINANNQAYNTETFSDFSITGGGGNTGTKNFSIGATPPAGSVVGQNCVVHWTANSMLGF